MAPLGNLIKLVIWDLDDTFWRGTLAEGGATKDSRAIEVLMTLASRGIVSSICSKNAHAPARDLLESWGVWSHFVFPQIENGPKGEGVATILGLTNLRPENVLFIDDNPLNLEEAAYYSPKLMTAHPADILPVLLDLPEAAGRPDPDLVQLSRYRLLEEKERHFASASLSRDEFLRQCDIRVGIDIDLAPHMDRIVDLLNKSNQLNFTKIRLGTERAVV